MALLQILLHVFRHVLVIGPLLATFSVAVQADAQVLVGLSGDLSGRQGNIGPDVRTGVRQAIADLNAKGGVLGHQIGLHEEDSACTPAMGTAAAQRMATRRPALVIGPVCTGDERTILAAAQAYQDAGLLMISPTATTPRLTDDLGYTIFRLAGRADLQARVIAGYLARQYAGRHVAVLFEGASQRRLALAVRRQMREGGLTEKLYAKLASNDMAGVLAALKAQKIGIAFVAAAPATVARLLRQTRSAGLSLQIMGTSALAGEAFRRAAGPLAEGVLLAAPLHPKTLQAAQELHAALRKAGHQPTPAMIFAYAALQAWHNAAQEAKSTKPLAVAAKLHEIELQTVLGRFRFDIKGDPTLPPFKIYRWGAQALVPVPDPGDNKCPQPPGQLPKIDPSTL